MYSYHSKVIITAFCLFAMFSPSAAAPVEYVSLEPPVVLPNGNVFKTWSHQTEYTRTYYVDQSHRAASDKNPGSKDKPFFTINKAAQIVRPGERVVVKSGVYRELIQPRFGGEGPDKMISYETAPGAMVIVKGSVIFSPEWKESKKDDSTYSAPLPEKLFGSYNPFLTENASKEDIDVMPWAAQ
ncbi:MAG: DUF1565 domain-containing protein, partial [Planctomycetota bacterium]